MGSASSAILSHYTTATPRATMLRWYFGCQSEHDTSSPCHSSFDISPVGSSADSSTSPKRPPRVQEKLVTKVRRGSHALAHKLQHGGKLWLKDYIEATWGCRPGTSSYDRLRQIVYRSITACHKNEHDELLNRPGKGKIAVGFRSNQVSPNNRIRADSLTRNRTKMIEVNHELFQWWVDMAETLQARIPTSSIIAQAYLIIEDAVRYVEDCMARGVTPPELNIPVINKVWIHRWRKLFSLRPRSITCSYKVSFIKKLMRLGVTWRNACRLLVFHELLFGPGRLTFVSMDEKPYRFNAAGADKVWARKGSRSVKCKEKRVALLERWTGITAVFSRAYGDSQSEDRWQPKWAALFKAVDGSRCNVHPPDSSVKVLYAEHGSVTTETWLAYLDFILPAVDNPRDAVIPTTDWYAPHLAEEAHAFALERTLSPTLMLGGGITAEAAVCDKTPHRVLAQRYKELESRDHMQAL